jgi:NTP pyrophosphatase (non-canonical NTP hydrolase)
MLVEPCESLTLSEYQLLARKTDTRAHEGDKDLAFPLLGLFGEVGSLLSEVKKKQRDPDSYVGYKHSVIEELGDVL